ncbi:uncharacterized protein [Struthio camelus]|uniref:uncharacterized protein n=1 Tax=Struthio camelus TaxID=8801 RepID=UPI003603E288
MAADPSVRPGAARCGVGDGAEEEGGRRGGLYPAAGIRPRRAARAAAILKTASEGREAGSIATERPPARCDRGGGGCISPSSSGWLRLPARKGSAAGRPKYTGSGSEEGGVFTAAAAGSAAGLYEELCTPEADEAEVQRAAAALRAAPTAAEDDWKWAKRMRYPKTNCPACHGDPCSPKEPFSSLDRNVFLIQRIPACQFESLNISTVHWCMEIGACLLLHQRF